MRERTRHLLRRMRLDFAELVSYHFRRFLCVVRSVLGLTIYRCHECGRVRASKRYRDFCLPCSNRLLGVELDKLLARERELEKKCDVLSRRLREAQRRVF